VDAGRHTLCTLVSDCLARCGYKWVYRCIDGRFMSLEAWQAIAWFVNFNRLVALACSHPRDRFLACHRYLSTTHQSLQKGKGSEVSLNGKRAEFGPNRCKYCTNENFTTIWK
jgi:hypothetical protein